MARLPYSRMIFAGQKFRGKGSGFQGGGGVVRMKFALRQAQGERFVKAVRGEPVEP